MSREKPIRRKLDIKNGRVDLSHGAGGRAMGQLIEEIFHADFDNDWLRAGNDQSAFDVAAGRMVMTTDAYVVSPIFFPGGDIGSLSVHGTINDIAMAGARPTYLSASFILEEGLALSDLKLIADSMGRAARQAGVPVVTGDTKVVERGKADGVFITTTGLGVAPKGLDLSSDKARPGDRVILSGSIGDHGVAVMSKRQNLSFETEIVSDWPPSTNSSPPWSTPAVTGCASCGIRRAAVSPRPSTSSPSSLRSASPFPRRRCR